MCQPQANKKLRMMRKDLTLTCQSFFSELGKDDFNTNDLKDLNQKRKTHRLKKSFANKDEPVKGKKKPKAKAKPKAKGKAKSKPKNFLDSLLKRARKLQKERREEHTDEPMAAAPVPEPPAPPPPPVLEPPAPPAAPVLEPPASPAAPVLEPPVPPPALPPDDEPDDEEMDAREPASSSRGPDAEPRGKTPDDVMEKLQPPGCKMGVSFKDHRFTSRWHYAHPELHSPYHTRNHSATFVTLRTWRECTVPGSTGTTGRSGLC